MKGKGPNLPAGIPAALELANAVTLQLRASDAQCLSVTLSDFKAQDAGVAKVK